MVSKFLTIESREIKVEELECMVANYNDHYGRFRTTIDNQEITLHGFTFEKDKILKLFGSGIGADKVFIALGVHDKNCNNEGREGFTTILIGMKDDKLILEDDKMFDYCDPCPQVCPDNITRLSSLRSEEHCNCSEIS